MFKVSADEFPINHATEVFNVFGSGVAVVNVVCVLPNVNCQEGKVVVGERVACVGSIEDSHFIIALGQPSPARTEIGDCLSGEVLEEVVKGSPLGKDELLKFAIELCFFRSDAVPVERMIPVLGSVVEDLLVFAAE